MTTTETLLDFFMETRQQTETICRPLEIEDYVVQPVVDVSPPKWHLGHTSWFYEEFILKPYAPDYKVFDEDFAFVFNSYYEAVGKRVVRADRGNLSRPSVQQVYDYRHYITSAINEFFEKDQNDSFLGLLETGIHHEKQHQELLLTDIKYILGNNPLLPVYSKQFPEIESLQANQQWIAIDEGKFEIGHNTSDFCYDNELGRHRVYLEAFQVSDRLVTNGEYMEFIEAGGYRQFELWHADAWDWVCQHAIKSPLYWHLIDGKWHCYTMCGLAEVTSDAAVTHISYYEAFAYAQWKGCRLPTEFEWEASQHHFNWGARWEWTESAYLPYPGYKKAEGALGEYNGKFMVNQKVLRGGSLATPSGHTRHTYRNFFQPQLRWQFTGIRLAR